MATKINRDWLKRIKAYAAFATADNSTALQRAAKEAKEYCRAVRESRAGKRPPLIPQPEELNRFYDLLLDPPPREDSRPPKPDTLDERGAAFRRPGFVDTIRRFQPWLRKRLKSFMTDSFDSHSERYTAKGYLLNDPIIYVQITVDYLGKMKHIFALTVDGLSRERFTHCTVDGCRNIVFRGRRDEGVCHNSECKRKANIKKTQERRVADPTKYKEQQRRRHDATKGASPKRPIGRPRKVRT